MIKRFDPIFDTNIYLEAAVNEYVIEDYGSKKYGNINSWNLLPEIINYNDVSTRVSIADFQISS